MFHTTTVNKQNTKLILQNCSQQ